MVNKKTNSQFYLHFKPFLEIKNLIIYLYAILFYHE